VSGVSRDITSKTVVTGVAGAPVRHSLSPLMHNAWLQAAGLDGVYVAFAPHQDRFRAFAEGLRGGAVRGLNVTIPFKEQALAVADEATALAKAAGAANLLLFHEDGKIEARNTDGEGLLQAIAIQAPGFDVLDGPVAVMGAGGAARGAVAALLEAGVADIRLCNRTLDRAEKLAEDLSGFHEGGLVRPFERADHAVEGCACVINATSLGLGGGPGPDTPWRRMRPEAVAMDMVYRPLDTAWLQEARAHGLRTVDGLEMLIRQAIPSYRAFFGADPPKLDVRALLLQAGAAG
jgi:shikimate dehydrogenase